jgi:exodeoxyribonuclease III
MRILSLNVNGLRSASSKGFYEWVASQKCDVLCLQEVRMQADQRDASFALKGYSAQFHDAVAKGYSGVAIYAKREPDRVHVGLGLHEFDSEGRWLQFDFADLSVVSLYMPSGTSGEARQDFKFVVMERLKKHLAKLKKDGRRYVICGDINIAHHPIDLKNWRGNQKNSGFLPQERAWMQTLIAEEKWVDTHRSLKPEIAEYTWWSNRGNAYANDVGWRIDYQIASPNMAGVAKAVTVHREPRFSDHAPLVVDYDLPKLTARKSA